ncbi:MAG: hypothetical protein QG610_1516 [Euryarchaeota archaeon]|nr:hypothetical protein [Euryarchaeota archaeon]
MHPDVAARQIHPRHSVCRILQTLAAFIEEIGLVKPHVLGLSFGAGLALEFYHRCPNMPRSLILASAYAGWAGSLSPDVVEERLQQGLQQSRLPPEQVVEKWIPTLFTKSAPVEVINGLRQSYPNSIRPE